MGPEAPLRATVQQAQVVRMVPVVLPGQQGPAEHQGPMGRRVLTALPVKLDSSSFPRACSFLPFSSLPAPPFSPSLHASLSPVFLPRPLAILALPCTNVRTHMRLCLYASSRQPLGTDLYPETVATRTMPLTHGLRQGPCHEHTGACHEHTGASCTNTPEHHVYQAVRARRVRRVRRDRQAPTAPTPTRLHTSPIRLGAGAAHPAPRLSPRSHPRCAFTCVRMRTYYIALSAWYSGPWCADHPRHGIMCWRFYVLLSSETPTPLHTAVVSTPLWKQGPRSGSRELHLVLVCQLPKPSHQTPKRLKGSEFEMFE